MDEGLQKDENLGRETVRKAQGCARERLMKLVLELESQTEQKYIGEHIQVSVCVDGTKDSGLNKMGIEVHSC